MQGFCNFVQKIVRLCNIILIIGRNRKQKAQKMQLSEPSNQQQ